MKALLNKFNITSRYQVIRLALIAFLWIVSAYLVRGQYWFIDKEEVNFIVLIVLGVLAIIGITSLIIFDNYKKVTKINYPLLAIFIMLFLSNTLVVAFTPSIKEFTIHNYIGKLYSFNVEITIDYRFYCITTFLGVLIFIYTFIVFIPSYMTPNSKATEVAVWLMIAFTCALCLFSFIKEFNNYIDFITHLNDNPEGYHTKSIFPHRNNWGMFLFYASFFALYLHVITKKRWVLVFPVIFYGFMVFSLCKTSLLLTLILLLIYLVYLLIKSFKDKFRRNLIIVCSIVFLFVTTTILLFTVPVLRSFMDRMILGRGNDSLESRTVIWSKIFEMNSNPVNIIFGVGMGMLNKNLYRANLADVTYQPNWFTFNAHSIYMEAYGDGGILLFISFMALLSYFAIKIVKYRKVDKSLSFLMAVGFVLSCIYWIVEG